MHLPVVHQQFSQVLLFLLVQRVKGEPAEVADHSLQVHADEVYGCCWLKSLHLAEIDRSVILLHLAIYDLVVDLLMLLCLRHVLLELFLLVFILIVLDGNHDLELLMTHDRKIRDWLVVVLIIFGLADV